QRAQTLQWMFFEQYSHEPYIAVARFWRHFFDKLTPIQELELPERMKKGYAALGVMEQHLARHPFFVGDRYGIADIALYGYTHVAGEGGFNLDAYPHVCAWLARVGAQPGYVTMDHKNRRERAMPMINVQMFEGRTLEQRRKLAQELTDATCRALG